MSGVQQRVREVDNLNHQIEEMYDSVQQKYMCKERGRSYKTDGWLRKHLVNEHNWEFGGENIDESKPDHIALYRSFYEVCFDSSRHKRCFQNGTWE